MHQFPGQDYYNQSMQQSQTFGGYSQLPVAFVDHQQDDEEMERRETGQLQD
jgi:hypothetical protein